jgi:DNA-directed RNA polymerase specialized sigma24 family protein
MDSDLESYLTPVIPQLVSSVERDLKRRVPGQYGVTIEQCDVSQQMWLTAVEHETILVKHLADGNDQAIATVLKGCLSSLYVAEVREVRAKKAALAGYETHDEVFYSTGALKRLLPMYLDNDREVAERAPASRDSAGRVSGGGGIYGDYAATMVDVDRAFIQLSEPKRVILSRYFSYPQGSGGFTHNEIAGRMGMNPSELSSRVHHALRALQRELGGQNPWNHGPTPNRGE